MLHCGPMNTQAAATPGTIVIGTSGWHYPHWRGRFYPPDLPREEWLAFYAGQLPGVEINNSFYRLPEPATIDRWRERTPPGFVFAVKAPRTITHLRKLRNCADTLGLFLGRLERFGRKLGPVLFQLPPRWHCNPARLEAFLGLLPLGFRYAFEFRDPSWHTDPIHALLREHGAASCIFDLEGQTSPLKTTTDFVYLRLHGPAPQPYSGSYADPALGTWSARVKRWTRREGRDVFLFFDNDERAHAVRNALRAVSLTVPSETGPG